MTVNKATIKVDECSIECSTSNQITGAIFFDFGNRQFPEKHWNDFVVVVLSWWLSALNDVISETLDGVELRFMDGPYFLRVTKLFGDECIIECREVGIGGEAEYSESIETAVLAGTMLRAAKKVELVCDHNGWDNADIRELRKRISELDRSMNGNLRAKLAVDD